MSLFKKLSGWFAKKRYERTHGKIQQVAVLTKPVVCFDRELEFSLPPGFRLYGNHRDALTFESPYLHISVQRVPFHRHLHSLTVRDIALRFRSAVPVLSMPEMTRGYLKHSATVSAAWQTQTADPRTEYAALYMVAVQQTVYIFLMTGNAAVISRYPAMIFASVQVHPERVDARLHAKPTALPDNSHNE